MSEPALTKKWRPALWMVVFGVFILVSLLPLAGLLVMIGFEQFFEFEFKLRTPAGFVTLALGSMFMGAVIGAIFLRALLRPLRSLMARTAEIEMGNENAFRPLEYGGTQEVATLGGRFFTLAQRLSDRSDYLTVFATHLGHELKTPLTSIQGAAELMRDSGDTMDAEQRQRFLQNVIDDTGRLNTLSGRLRDLARADVATTRGECRLDHVIKQAVQNAGLALNFSGRMDRSIDMSGENAEIVWSQLANNAAEHGATQFWVTVSERDEKIHILIGDDGAAISKANQGQLFDPFFTTRREQGGTGMGLGIAEAMLRSHGGTISVASAPDFKFEIVMADRAIIGSFGIRPETSRS